MSCQTGEIDVKSNNSDGDPMPDLLDAHDDYDYTAPDSEHELVRQPLTRAEWESHKMPKFIAGILADPPVDGQVVKIDQTGKKQSTH
jgi:hypothetical protein